MYLLLNNILENPYRILGLLAGVSAREFDRQVRRLKQFIEIQEAPLNDYSLPYLGKLNRSIENITEAESRLQLNSDKIKAALFWFYNGNPITDEPALEALKIEDIDTSIKVWGKLTRTSEVTQKNISAFHNLSTLLLIKSLILNDFDENLFESAVYLKLKALESDFNDNFILKVADETYKTSAKELQLVFLNTLLTDLKNNGSSSIIDLVKIINKSSFSVKDDFLKKFFQENIEQIELNIEATKTRRKENRKDSLNAGKELLLKSKKELNNLEILKESNHTKYISIADKLANEILQCCIDYTNLYIEEEDIEYIDDAMLLMKEAEKIAIGKLTKDRIKENIEALKELKNKEILIAIYLLEDIKNNYELIKETIYNKVKERYPITYAYFIDWREVDELVDKSIDWEKVTELIEEAIPEKNVNKIAKTNDVELLRRYKELVKFIMSKLNHSQKNRIKYICYWKTHTQTSKSLINKDFSTENSPLIFKIIVYGLILYFLLSQISDC